MRKRIKNNPSADPQQMQQMQHPQHPQHMLHMQHRENTLHREETLHREDPLASPELRQNPFSAPAGYMDSFEERIMQRISGQQEHFGQQHVSSQQCVSSQQHVSGQQHGLGLRALLKPAIGFAASFALLFSLGYGIISLTKFLEKTPQKIALQMRDTTISSPIENNVANQTNEEAAESIDAAEEYLIYYGATIATLTADATE
ncbi:MAG: hypothetical protein SPH62_06300 [Candidatus Egerieousia sp.]|nr:hypothetical protein [bacterium]MDY5255992.1 hypothetical protein [Candidatus Egerieousia sp.]